jgi:hypothetical protein
MPFKKIASSSAGKAYSEKVSFAPTNKTEL